MWGPILGALTTLGGKLWDKASQKNAEQKAANFNPIQKRVQDAKAAGVHPLYALGANVSEQSAPAQVAFGETLGKMGQSIGSSIDRGLDHEGKAVKALLLEKAGLENELLRSQIAKANRDLTAQPTIPGFNQEYMIPGQAKTAMPSSGEYTALPGHKAEQPQHTRNFRWMGVDVPRSRWGSDAQVFEDIHGEGTGTLMALPGWAADMRKWVQYAWAKHMKEFMSRANRRPIIRGPVGD